MNVHLLSLFFTFPNNISRIENNNSKRLIQTLSHHCARFCFVIKTSYTESLRKKSFSCLMFEENRHFESLQQSSSDATTPMRIIGIQPLTLCYMNSLIYKTLLRTAVNFLLSKQILMSSFETLFLLVNSRKKRQVSALFFTH